MFSAAAQPNTSSAKPRIGITIGDPAGIGPEVTLKALSSLDGVTELEAVIIGDLGTLKGSVLALSLDIGLQEYSKSGGVAGVSVVDLNNVGTDFLMGTESALTGRASGQYIQTAVEMWRNGEIDAIATAPINKRALQMGGFNYPGHTEFLAELTGTNRFAMSFFAENLRVVLLSTHLSLKDAIGLVKKSSIADLITFADDTLSNLLGRTVKIAVAGLNPHASEEGLFGREEIDEIRPAVEVSRSRGIDVHGPFSPDTIFLRAFRGEFDAVVACYHDQATIPVKAFSFGSAVNVTLGLPFVRTSVDHGTAYDIAGKGIADASSMRAAIKLAAQLSHRADPAPRPS